jgi:hypothetical protein
VPRGDPFRLTKPCHNCPFRREGGIRLHPERAREIAHSQIRAVGGMFSCHKTVHHDDDGEHAPHEKEQYCAGAVAFTINVGSENQLLQVSRRMRMWHPRDIEERDEVFRSVDEMVAAQREAWGRHHHESSK